MSKQSFNNHFDYEGMQTEKIVGKSMTIPEQEMSVQEILRRFASGLPINAGMADEYYDSDEMTPEQLNQFKGRNFRQLDLSEQMDLIASEQSRILSQLKQENESQPTPPAEDSNSEGEGEGIETTK